MAVNVCKSRDYSSGLLGNIELIFKIFEELSAIIAICVKTHSSRVGNGHLAGAEVLEEPIAIIVAFGNFCRHGR